MASHTMQVFHEAGDLTFVLVGPPKERRRSTAILYYKAPKETRIYMRVSSDKMMQASPVFRAMLKTKTFKEGTILYKKGKVEVPLPDDDYAAFAVLLDIVHGRYQKVPREVNLPFLTKLAILVDKYRLQKVVQSWSKQWMDVISRDTTNVPKAFTDDLMLWLTVSWVFRRPVEFNLVTRIAERESNGTDLHTYYRELDAHLPIPQRIIDNILRRRDRAISQCFELIARYLDILQMSEPRCTSKRPESHRFTCNTVLLGSLLESTGKLGIWPPPDTPYQEWSFKDLAKDMERINIVSFCSKMGYTREASSSHGVKTEIGSAVDKIRNKLSGLNLKDFD